MYRNEISDGGRSKSSKKKRKGEGRKQGGSGGKGGGVDDIEEMLRQGNVGGVSYAGMKHSIGNYVGVSGR